MNKLMKKIVTVMLALTMVMGMVLSVSADPGAGLQQGDPSKAEITKILKVPVGGVKPAEDFNFSFTAKGITSDEDGALISDMTGMPIIGDAGKVTIPNSALTPSGTVDGYQIFSGTVDAFNIDESLSIATISGDDFPHAGVYVYDIDEVEPMTPTGNMIYSKAIYRMYVYVTNTDAIDGTLRINDIGFRIMQLDGEGIDPEGAVLPTQALDPDSGTDSTAAKADPIFTNRYTPPADLEVTKTVAGEFADDTKLFTYTLVVTRPQAAADADGEQTYVGTIYNGTTATGDTVTVKFTDNETTGTVTSTTSEDATFKLSHGQRLDFLQDNKEAEPGSRTGLPMGSKWTLTEAGEFRYSASVTYNAYEKVNQSAGATAGNDNNSVTIPETGELILGSTTNNALWLNTYNDVTPTGILLNNLPFILLIVVAIGGFVGYIASKRRKASN